MPKPPEAIGLLVPVEAPSTGPIREREPADRGTALMDGQRQPGEAWTWEWDGTGWGISTGGGNVPIGVPIWDDIPLLPILGEFVQLFEYCLGQGFPQFWDLR